MVDVDDEELTSAAKELRDAIDKADFKDAKDGEAYEKQNMNVEDEDDWMEVEWGSFTLEHYLLSRCICFCFNKILGINK